MYVYVCIGYFSRFNSESIEKVQKVQINNILVNKNYYKVWLLKYKDLNIIILQVYSLQNKKQYELNWLSCNVIKII